MIIILLCLVVFHFALEDCHSYCDQDHGVCIYRDDITSSFRTRELPDYKFTKSFFEDGICYCREGFSGRNCSDRSDPNLSKTEQNRNLGCRKTNKHNKHKCECNLGYGSPDNEQCVKAPDNVCTLRGIGDPFYFKINIPTVYAYGWQCMVGNSEEFLNKYRILDYVFVGIRGGVILLAIFGIIYLFFRNLIGSLYHQRENYSMRFMVCSNGCLFFSILFLLMYEIVNVLTTIFEEKMNYVTFGWSFFPLYFVELGTRLYCLWMLLSFLWVCLAFPYRQFRKYFIDIPWMFICCCPICCYITFFIVLATLAIQLYILMLGNLVKLVTIGIEFCLALVIIFMFTLGIIFWAANVVFTLQTKPVFDFFLSKHAILGILLFIVYVFSLVIEIVFLVFIVFSEFWRPLYSMYYTNRYIYINLFFQPLVEIIHVLCVYFLYLSMFYLSSIQYPMCNYIDRLDQEKESKRSKEDGGGERKEEEEEQKGGGVVDVMAEETGGEESHTDETTGLLSGGGDEVEDLPRINDGDERIIDEERDAIIRNREDEREEEEKIETPEQIGQINNADMDDQETSQSERFLAQEEERRRFHEQQSSSSSQQQQQGSEMSVEERFENMIMGMDVDTPVEDSPLQDNDTMNPSFSLDMSKQEDDVSGQYESINDNYDRFAVVQDDSLPTADKQDDKRSSKKKKKGSKGQKKKKRQSRRPPPRVPREERMKSASIAALENFHQEGEEKKREKEDLEEKKKKMELITSKKTVLPDSGN